MKQFKVMFEIKVTKPSPFLPRPRYPSGRVLVSSAGGPGLNPQSHQRRYKNGTSSSLV